MNFAVIEKHQGKILVVAAVIGLIIALAAIQIPGFIKPANQPAAAASSARTAAPSVSVSPRHS